MKSKRFLSWIIAMVLIVQTLSVPALAKAEENTVLLNNSKELKIDSKNLTAEANSEHAGKEAYMAVDGTTDTFWDAAWADGDKGLGVVPIIMTITLDKVRNISKLTYVPRMDDGTNGTIKGYKLSVINEQGQEQVVIPSGTWAMDKTMKTASFAPVRASAVKLEVLDASTSNAMATASEISLYEQIAVLEMDKEAMAIKTGESKPLQVTTASTANLTWSSENPDIAIVDNAGIVTGLKEGKTFIYATDASGAQAACDVSVSQSNEMKKPGYVMVFEDNFDGDTLDNTKWNNWCVDLDKADYFRYGNTPDSVVAPENVKVGDGMLHLLGTKDPVTFDGQVSNYKMGTVQTRDKFQPTYGYMEAMVRFPDVAGSNPAVWTMPRRTADNTDWQWNSPEGEGAEIDILERPHPLGDPAYAGLADKYWTTIHFDNYNGSLKFHKQPTINNPYEWHKFGMEWTKDAVKLMLDGNVVATYDGAHVPQAPEILILSYGLGGWLGTIDPNMVSSEMVVDYVRWYQEDPIKAKLSDDAITVKEGETKELSVSFVKDGEAAETDDFVTGFTSQDPTVATVDDKGLVTGIKEGTTTISMITNDLRTASCEVSISEPGKIKPGYRLVFEDNFDGTKLDNTKWNNWCVDLTEAKPFRYGNSPEVALVPENAYVKDGSLRLLGSKEETTFDGMTSDYRMGAVQTRDIFEPKYGYVEVMLKIPDVPGSNPAVWTMPQAAKDGGFLWDSEDGFGAEIDILERPHPMGDAQYAGLKNKYWVTMHYDNYNFTNHAKFHTQPTINDPYKWHKFGMEWTPEYINFMLDGKVVATQNKDVPNTKEIFILSYGLGGWIGKIADEYLPAEMLVDYVRWYQVDDTTVSATPASIDLKAGDTKKITVEITPSTSKDQADLFISRDPEIASVDKDGVVSALREGKTQITVITKEGRTARCTVSVTGNISYGGGGTSLPGDKTDNNKAKDEITVDKSENGNVITVETQNAAVKTEGNTAKASITIEKAQIDKAAQGLSGKIDTVIKLGKNDLITELKKDNINNLEIEVKIPAITISKLVLTSEILNAAGGKKDISVKVNDDSGKFLYKWSFSKENLNLYGITSKDLNLYIKADKANLDFVKENGVMIEIDQKGFIAGASVKINVANLTDKKQLYLYYVNKNTKKLKLVSAKKYNVSKNGYLTINTEKGSNYILLEKKVK